MFAPPPYGPIANAALGALTIALGLYARARSRAAEGWAAQVKAVVRGVEALPSEEGKQAKRAIQRTAERTGVGEALHATVQRLTK